MHRAFYLGHELRAGFFNDPLKKSWASYSLDKRAAKGLHSGERKADF
jgi:hypothetical protein